MALTSAEAQVLLVPSLKGFQKKVAAGVRATRAPDINVKINVDRKALAKAEADARKAADRVASARRIEQGATDKVAASERNLAEARKRGEHTASALAIMERRVAREKEAASRASRGAAKAAADEERAVRRVAAAQSQLDKSLSGRRRTRVEVDSSSLLRATIHARRLKSELGGLAKAGLLASAGIAAVGAGGAALAALPAVIGSVTAGVGVLGFSLSGVGEALKGFQADQEAAAGASASTAASALSDARTLKSAQSAIDDAKRNSARIARTGAEQIQAASERVTDAVANEKRAQADLAQSYKDARRELTDLRDAQAGYASSVEGAQIALLRQQERYREVMGDAASTDLDRREAAYELVEAQLRVKDATKAQARSAEELRESERKGVAGSDQVVAARERLIDAQDQVRESRLELQRTERDAAEANQDAARAVADAVENLTDTQAAQAASAAGAAGATSKYAEAMAKLTPEAQALVRQLVSMGPLIDGLKSAAGRDFLPGVTQMLRDSEGLFPIFETNLQRTGSIMGDTARDFGRLFKSDEFKKNLDQMFRNSETVTKAIGGLFLGITDSLVTMGAKTSQTQSGFAAFTDSLNSGLQGFFDKLSTPQADKAFGELWRELGRLLDFLLPKLADLAVWAAEKVGPAIGALTDFLTRNKDRLGEWAFAIGVAVLAIKGLNIVKSVVGWANGIAGAFRIIRDDAGKASSKVGGLSDKLGGLKGIAGAAIGIGIIVSIDEATDGAVANLLNYLSGNTPIDVNDRTRDIFGALPPVAGDENDVRNLPATLQRIKGQSDRNWEELKAGVKSAFTAPPAVPGDELDVRNLPQTFQRIKGQSDKNWEELKNNVTNFSGQAWSGVTGWWNRTSTDVGNKASEIRDNAGNRLRELRDGASARASETWSNVSGWWSRTKTDVGNRASELAANAGSKFTELKNGASARAGEIWSSVSGWFTRTRDDATDRIRTLVDNVGRKWDELKGFFARPIKWVIDYVWNGTIANLWGKARELIPALPEFKRLASGGEVRGPGTATSDSIPAMLSNGEFVLSAADVKRLGGFSRVEQLRRGGFESAVLRRAEGGPVTWQELRDTVTRAIPGTRMSSGYRPGHAGEHGKGLAADFTGNLPAIQNWIVSRFPGSHEIIGPVERQNIFNGRQHRYDAATVAGHKDHVHWARKEHGKGLLSNILDGISGAWDTVSTFFRESMTGIFDGPANAIRGMLGNLFPGDTLANRLPKDGAGQLLDGVRDFLFGKADSEDAGAGGFADGGPTTGDMLGNARVIANVGRQLGFGRNGIVVALATALQESGLRNINYGDRDSVGLFQQRPSQGWGSVAQIMNPSYSASKFFSALRAVRGWESLPVTVAAQRVQRSAYPDAYAKWVGKANSLASQVGFRDGGLIGGVGNQDNKLVLAQSGERVLSRTQNEWFEGLVTALPSVSGAVRDARSGYGLDGLTHASGNKETVHNHTWNVRETVDVDRAVSRLVFLSGGL